MYFQVFTLLVTLVCVFGEYVFDPKYEGPSVLQRGDTISFRITRPDDMGDDPNTLGQRPEPTVTRVCVCYNCELEDANLETCVAWAVERPDGYEGVIFPFKDTTQETVRNFTTNASWRGRFIFLRMCYSYYIKCYTSKPVYLPWKENPSIWLTYPTTYDIWGLPLASWNENKTRLTFMHERVLPEELLLKIGATDSVDFFCITAQDTDPECRGSVGDLGADGFFDPQTMECSDESTAVKALHSPEDLGVKEATWDVARGDFFQMKVVGCSAYPTLKQSDVISFELEVTDAPENPILNQTNDTITFTTDDPYLRSLCFCPKASERPTGFSHDMEVYPHVCEHLPGCRTIRWNGSDSETTSVTVEDGWTTSVYWFACGPTQEINKRTCNENVEETVIELSPQKRRLGHSLTKARPEP